MALPVLDSVFASSADLPRKQMLAKWLVEELGETQAPSSVLVSGAGSSFCNGIYVQSGESAGKPQYVKSGGGVIYWDSSSWLIDGNGEDPDYETNEDVANPWLAISWNIANGEAPVPSVTEVPAPSPISNYWTLSERYLWAKIAVAAGAPRGEADYISLPKNYVWSDIYNAVAGLIPPSSVLVSGLGVYNEVNPNGNYSYSEIVDGKPKYINSSNDLIGWNGDNWSIVFSNADTLFSSEEDVAYPWLVTNWTANNGSGNPVVAEIPQPTPNHTDWSEKQALGHIAAAYRGDTGNPEALATYINWPWRYQVASIIGSLLAPPEPETFNAVIVAGAGSAVANGTYTLSGQEGGKNKYVLNDQYVAWSIENSWWAIYAEGYNRYISFNDTEFPWDATFEIEDADEPPPTLTPTTV